MAVGTGFGQVFRGLGNSRALSLPCMPSDVSVCTGQVCGVAISSALFQSKLNSELHARIHTPDADEVSHINIPTLSIATDPRLSPDNQSDSTFDDARRAT